MGRFQLTTTSTRDLGTYTQSYTMFYTDHTVTYLYIMWLRDSKMPQ